MKWVSTAQKRVANFFIFNGEMFSNARCYDSGSGAFTGFWRQLYFISFAIDSFL